MAFYNTLVDMVDWTTTWMRGQSGHSIWYHMTFMIVLLLDNNSICDYKAEPYNYLFDEFNDLPGTACYWYE